MIPVDLNTSFILTILLKNLIFQKVFELKISEFGLKVLDKFIGKIADKSLFLQQMDGL